LEKVLASAAMDNKTVFITSLNKAWIEKDSIFGIFLMSFKYGIDTEWLINHLVVICFDETAFEYCTDMRTLHCYHFEIEDVDLSDEALFMTPNYLEMMFRRILVLTNILELGYSFLFSDTDIMWLRNPFPHLHPDADFQVASDHFAGDPFSPNSAANCGLLYIRSTPATIQFLKMWYEEREFNPNIHDQDLFGRLKYCPAMRKIGLRIKYLNTQYFGGICEPSRDMNLVCSMHTNCCVGLEKKKNYLKSVLEDWKNYLTLPLTIRKSNPPSWSLSQ
ncbi:hypothetical protein M569_15496, partial [Genlisea aurea]